MRRIIVYQGVPGGITHASRPPQTHDQHLMIEKKLGNEVLFDAFDIQMSTH